MDDYPSNSLIIQLFIAACCIVLSSLFSASESAFLGLNKLRVHFLREKGNKRAVRVYKLLEKKEELLNMLLVGNELVNVALSVVLTSIFLKLFGPAGLGIATGISTVALLILGEITPKSLTTRFPEKSAFFLSRYVKFFFLVLRPFVIIFTSISRFFLSILGIKTSRKDVSFTEEEIKTFIDVGGEEGVLETGEKNMMNRVFKFTDLNATDIMVPRLDVIGIGPEFSYRDIIQLSERTRISRFPVYENDDIDNIIGVLYVKDLLFFRGERETFSVKSLMKQPIFIPGTTKMSSIQEMLRKNRQSFAVVIDEYSGTDGILTTEDIEREIFGAIADDFEKAGATASIHIKDLNDSMLDGSARLSDLEDELHIKLESRINETIGGYISEKLGHIPVPGEAVTVSPYRFEVVSMDMRRVENVHCTKISGGEE